MQFINNTMPHMLHHLRFNASLVMLSRRMQPDASAPHSSSTALRRCRCCCVPSSSRRNTSEQSDCAAQQGPPSSQAVPAPPSAVTADGVHDDDAPLLSAVLARGNRAHDVPLHVPGHKVRAPSPHLVVHDQNQRQTWGYLSVTSHQSLMHNQPNGPASTVSPLPRLRLLQRGRAVDEGMQQLSLRHDLTELAGGAQAASPGGPSLAAASNAQRQHLLETLPASSQPCGVCASKAVPLYMPCPCKFVGFFCPPPLSACRP